MSFRLLVAVVDGVVNRTEDIHAYDERDDCALIEYVFVKLDINTSRNIYSKLIQISRHYWQRCWRWPTIPKRRSQTCNRLVTADHFHSCISSTSYFVRMHSCCLCIMLRYDKWSKVISIDGQNDKYPKSTQTNSRHFGDVWNVIITEMLSVNRSVYLKRGVWLVRCNWQNGNPMRGEYHRQNREKKNSFFVVNYRRSNFKCFRRTFKIVKENLYFCVAKQMKFESFFSVKFWFQCVGFVASCKQQTSMDWPPKKMLMHCRSSATVWLCSHRWTIVSMMIPTTTQKFIDDKWIHTHTRH